MGSGQTSSSRFRILRPYTQGGLGELFVARDEDLQREVILKRIRNRLADHPESRGRFVREAHITGSLEHPGIVPVYGLGEDGDGRPFYAMRLIQGETLQAAIERFHQSVSAGAEKRESRELRRLLSRLLVVCHTIAYAHSQGVLHRDLKPDNIMLGAYGETLVVDWGVAKANGQPDEFAEPLSAPSEDLPGDSDLTQLGRTLGTPQYMSPEQAAGLLHRLTPASDVYSLGATLYCLLTGQGPFEGVEADLLPHLVQGGDFQPPRQMHPWIPPALEAVCLKAMARKPEERYQSVSELAEEIERWLADDLVLAYPEGWGERCWRWARRHRGWVGVGLAASLILAIVAIASDLHRRERQRADFMARAAEERQVLLQEVEVQRQVAETEHQHARESERLATGLLYFSRINMAERAWSEARIPQMQALLAEQRRQQPTLLGFEWDYLWNLPQSAAPPLYESKQAVAVVAYSPDGRVLLSAGDDGSIRVWNADTGRCEQCFVAHSGRITALAFSPDNAYLVSASHDRTLKVWRRSAQPSFEPLSTTPAHDQGVNCLAFDRAGQRLATGSIDGTLKLWQFTPQTPKVVEFLRILPPHRYAIHALSFSPDGKFLASGGGNPSDLSLPGELRICDTSGRSEPHCIWDKGGALNAVVYSPEGETLATAGQDHTIKIWNSVSFNSQTQRPPQQTLRGHSNSILALAYSEDGARLASASEDRTIRVWTMDDGQEWRVYRGHGRLVSTVALRPQSHWLASGSEDGAVRVWDLNRVQGSQVLRGHTKDVNAVAVHPNGQILVSASDDGTIGLWDLHTAKKSRSIEGPSEGVNDVALSHDGQWLSFAGADGSVGIRELATGKPLATLRIAGVSQERIAISPDGRRIAAAGRDGWVRVWELDPGSGLVDSPPSAVLKLADAPASGVLFLPGGASLVAAAIDGSVVSWDPQTGVERFRFSGQQGGVHSLAISPDGRYLACGGQDRSIKLWDLLTQEEYRLLRGHMQMVTALDFSPDGRRLLSGSNDQTVKLWDTETGETALTLHGHTDTVTKVAFGPNGRWLVSVSDDWTIRLWGSHGTGNLAPGSSAQVAQARQSP